MNRSLITLILSLLLISAGSQVVYENSDKAVYDLLDELANDKIIDINDVVKPWSRLYIAHKLEEARAKEDLLSQRQKDEISFYMKDYRLEVMPNTRDMGKGDAFPENDHLATSLDPLSFQYRDSLFAFSLRPSWGMSLLANKSEIAFMNKIGGEAFGYYSKNIGIYARYHYGYESTLLTSPTYLLETRGELTNQLDNGGQDYHHLNWGMMYSWKWGALGIVRDRPEWGNAYHGTNILSAHAPPFTQIKLQLKPVKWFEFNYIHCWLHSDVVDSSRSYWNGNNYEEVMRRKYIAANMFTFKPIPFLNISFGNSIIYSDISVQAAYLVPFLFFRLADYEISAMSDDASGNSQIFFSLSSRNLKHLHLYFSMFIDELSIYRFGDEERNNFFSYKGGLRLSNWPLQNLSLTAEYTYTLPAVYDHYIHTNTFTSDSYVLGHYMQDNAHDLYLALQYKPIPRLIIKLDYNFGQHGNDIGYGDEGRADEIPMLEEITWQKSIIGLDASYRFLSNASVFAGIVFSSIESYPVDEKPAEYYLEKFTPEMYWGNKVTGKVGFNIGL